MDNTEALERLDRFRRAVYDPASPLGAEVLVRLPKQRRFFRKPPPYPGRGGPRKHGAVFNPKKPETLGTPDHTAHLLDPERGRVQVDLWGEMLRCGSA